MKCDIKIMGCAKREANIAYLCNKLNLSFSDVAMDWVMSGNPLLTSMQAFRMPYKTGVTHRCVIQDDIDICEDFSSFINTLVELYPQSVFSLYCQTSKLLNYADGSVMPTGGAVHAPAIIMPLALIEDIYNQWQATCPDYIHDDRYYSRYFKQHGIQVLTTKPCLVTLTDMPSELKHNGMFKNIAYSPSSPMELNWHYDKHSLHKPAEK